MANRTLITEDDSASQINALGLSTYTSRLGIHNDRMSQKLNVPLRLNAGVFQNNNYKKYQKFVKKKKRRHFINRYNHSIKCINFYLLCSHRSKNISKLRKLEDKILNNKHLKKSQIIRFQTKLKSSFGNKFFDQLPAHHPKNNAYLSR
jgi:Fe2+ transport system protein B